MNSKHSKEEWQLKSQAVTLDDGRVIKTWEIVPKGRFRIAYLQSSDEIEYGCSEDEMMANARLMVNAPKMLEALLQIVRMDEEAVAEMIENKTIPQDYDIKSNLAYAKAVEAITEATTNTP